MQATIKATKAMPTTVAAATTKTTTTLPATTAAAQKGRSDHCASAREAGDLLQVVAKKEVHEAHHALAHLD